MNFIFFRRLVSLGFSDLNWWCHHLLMSPKLKLLNFPWAPPLTFHISCLPFTSSLHGHCYCISEVSSLHFCSIYLVLQYFFKARGKGPCSIQPYIYFFHLFVFNWRIAALQYCVGFCQTSPVSLLVCFECINYWVSVLRPFYLKG